MATKPKARRPPEGGTFDRTTFQRKERVYQKILQQCVNMRNQGSMSADSIVLCGRHNAANARVVQLESPRMKRKRMRRVKKSRFPAVDISPSIESLRSIKLYSRSMGDIYQPDEISDRNGHNLPPMKDSQLSLLLAKRAERMYGKQQLIKRSVAQASTLQPNDVYVDANDRTIYESHPDIWASVSP